MLFNILQHTRLIKAKRDICTTIILVYSDTTMTTYARIHKKDGVSAAACLALCDTTLPSDKGRANVSHPKRLSAINLT